MNEKELAELELLKTYLADDNDSNAFKFALKFSLHTLESVTSSHFPPNYDVLFRRKTKSGKLKRKIYD